MLLPQTAFLNLVKVLIKSETERLCVYADLSPTTIPVIYKRPYTKCVIISNVIPSIYLLPLPKCILRQKERNSPVVIRLDSVNK